MKLLRLEMLIEKYGMNGTTLMDRRLDSFPFLQEEEDIYNEAGERVSKSFLDMKGNEVARITYEKIIETIKFEGLEYKDVFTGTKSELHYYDTAGDIVRSKLQKIVKFRLEPIIENNEVVGFTSKLMRQMLADEENNAQYKK